MAYDSVPIPSNGDMRTSLDFKTELAEWVYEPAVKYI